MEISHLKDIGDVLIAPNRVQIKQLSFCEVFSHNERDLLDKELFQFIQIAFFEALQRLYLI